MNTLHLDETVGDLVRLRPSRSRVFQNFGIDFCCGGKRTLAAACREQNLDPTEVLNDLAVEESLPARHEVDFTLLRLDALCDYIETKHHAFLRSELPRLCAMARRVAEVHGAHHPWVVDIHGTLLEFAREISEHLEKEERVLFPEIRRRVQGQGTFSTIQRPVTVMEHEHDSAGDALREMRRLSQGFTVPEGACNTFTALIHGLAELEADTHLHIHLENNILFPRALSWEQEVSGV